MLIKIDSLSGARVRSLCRHGAAAHHGLVCSDATTVTCAQITHDSNVLGEQEGCDNTCGVPPETEEEEETEPTE